MKTPSTINSFQLGQKRQRKITFKGSYVFSPSFVCFLKLQMNISAKIVIWIENINNALKTIKRADNFKKLRGDKTYCNVAIDMIHPQAMLSWVS
jgi:hypothetical protein